MSHNDKLYAENFDNRFQTMRETLDDKTVVYQAVQKNMLIVQAMAEHQRKEIKLLRK